MSKKRSDVSDGYGKLLEYWEAPDGSGEPIGCVATTFTFSPAFFEEECLGRFLKMETDASEDGPLYLVEREEKLSQVVCAAVLVDQHNCKGARSLRWDLHPARLNGLLHAKISLLCWSDWVRLIIGSANITEDGYRRNQEVFGVVDYNENSDSPRQVLVDVVDYLREMMISSQPDVDSKAIERWYKFLDRIVQKTGSWGETREEHKRKPMHVDTILTGGDRADVFKQFLAIWPAGSPPHTAKVLSPFFDPPEALNRPAQEIWEIMRKRGETTVNYCLEMIYVPDENRLIARAPATLQRVKPSRDAARVIVHCLKTDQDRPLHAKELWFEDNRYALLMAGSSNFTSAGLGLGKKVNYEANLVYVLDRNRAKGVYKDLLKRFPESVVASDPEFESTENEDDKPNETVVLPFGFRTAVFRLKDGKAAEVVLELGQDLPAQWKLMYEDQMPWQDALAWEKAGKPSNWVVPWEGLPPSGIWVTWYGVEGMAWWPVNVESSTDLPPPDELKELPLEILINLLTSARPLHEVLRRYLRKHNRVRTVIDDGSKDVDPHKRVDTSEFILQRTRRFSWALNSLGKRLERPVPTEECLNWRIHGPVGVVAVANALKREAKSTEESMLLVAELALELARVRPAEARGCLPAGRIREVLLETAQALCRRENILEIPTQKHLRMYLKSVTDYIESQVSGA